MKKLIASKFELDLSNYEITTTETNPWFSDAFTSKITYPFEIYLTPEIDAALGFVTRNTSFDTFFDVKYFEDDNMHEATFEILEEQDGRLQVSYEYGLEEFPLWETKLSELPLEKFDLVGQTMYQHAKANVNKVWPEKNYAFPAIHTPLYSVEEETWAYFEGLINNYQYGEFLENSFDTEEAIQINRNIIQPLPAFMHIMQTIATTAGYILAGDILTDTKLHDNFIYSAKENFKKREPVEFYLEELASNPTSTIIEYAGNKMSFYNKQQVVLKKGKYNISGFFRVLRREPASGHLYIREVKISLGSTVIFAGIEEDYSTFDVEFPVDFDFDVTGATSKTLSFYAESNYFNPLDPLEDFKIMDFNITMVAEYSDLTEEPIPTIDQPNQIDLSKNVPDMTVGEFITALKNWHNYDYTIKGNQAVFNKIQDHMDFQELVSLEEFESKSKLRKFQQGMSFLLKFTDTEESKYTFNNVFQDVKGVEILNYKTNKYTNTIDINALPLPLENIRSFETANAFENSDSKLYIVRYAGLINGRNKTLTNEPLLLPQMHMSNFVNWFTFRINAMSFKISFKAFNNQVKGLNSKSKIFMYNKLHYIKSIMKTQSTPDILDVEIETESIK